MIDSVDIALTSFRFVGVVRTQPHRPAAVHRI
jgi:hypothetical protein